jgi:hypothetical protein
MHLLEASTNQLGCVGWVHPKPLPTECGSLMGFAWVSLLATLCLDACWMGVARVRGSILKVMTSNCHHR